MKKLLATALAIGLLGSMSVSAVTATQQPQHPKQPGFISVNTTSEDEFAPNIAQINFYIETSDKNLANATAENKKIAAKTMEAVKKVIQADKGDTIKTLSFNVNSEYTYGKDGKRTFDKYKVVNSFEVKLKNTQELGKVIDTALNSGATRVDGLRFTLDTNEAMCNELIARATQTAKQRAQSVANSLSVKLGGVKEINTSCHSQSSPYPSYRVMNAKSSLDMAEGGEVPTEAGTIKIMANASAQFWINP